MDTHVFKDIGRASAAEQLTSAYCNMQCEYCYIPKVDGMKEMHNEIVDALKNPEVIIGNLKKAYGDQLVHLSFWGTEPTTIIHHITNNLELYFEAFPRLREFGFSTNFLVHTDRIHRFIDRIEALAPKYMDDVRFNKDETAEKRFIVSAQISLDGPAFITDTSRQAGATAKIVENFKTYVAHIKDSQYKHTKVSSRFKPTVSIDHMRAMAENPELMKEYFTFFSDMHGIYKSYFDGREPYFSMTIAGSGTLMVPGTYTVADGRTFARHLRHLDAFSPMFGENSAFPNYKYIPSEYLQRFMNMMESENNSAYEPTNLTCSGGDSNYAIDIKGDIHICHRTFYMNDKRYIDAVQGTVNPDNWDVSLFEDEKIRNIQKNYIVNMNDEYESARFLTVLRGFHDYREFRVSYVFSMTKWLAKAGQVDMRLATDDRLCRLFSEFIVYVFGCSIENILNTTSIHFTPVSIIKMFGNGAFLFILECYEKTVGRYLE